jgi:hypothetical protein
LSRATITSAGIRAESLVGASVALKTEIITSNGATALAEAVQAISIR